MSKLEKLINSKNNSIILSKLTLKKTNLYSKSAMNKNKPKINFSIKTKEITGKIKLSKIILDFFLKINEMDNSIETIRSKLFSFSDFSPKSLFSFLDKKSKNFLTLNDFKIFLKDNNISFSEKNLRKFIHNFDKNNDFCLNYEEFLGLISPKKTENIKNNSNKQDDVGKEIQKYFCELMNEEMKFIEKYFELSEKILRFKEFSIYEAFKEIVGEEKYINIENMKKFFNKKKTKLDENEINHLLFRIDKDNDGMVSYEKFKEIFSSLNNTEIVNHTNRDYNKEFFYQYDIDDENDDIRLNEDNINDIIKNDNEKSNNKKTEFSLKEKNDLNIKENKENDTKIINIIKAEERYKFNYETDLENMKNKKDNNNMNIINNTDLDNNMSNSIFLYKENMKNTRREIENNKKDYNQNTFLGKNKSVNNHNYFTHSHSNNNLLEQTKSVLGMNHVSILSKIKVNSGKNNIKQNNRNINLKKKVIEIEYENDYKMETPLQKNKIDLVYNNEKSNVKNSEPISDSVLNYDYSRYTNRDRKNGTYYFKQKNKGEIAESNNSTNNISNISDEESNNKNDNKDKELIFRNKIAIKNINKRNSFSYEYNNKLFSFKDEINPNINRQEKNDEKKKRNKNILQIQSKTFDREEFNNKNNLNFNYEQKIDNYKTDNNSYNTNTIDDIKNAQKYLDSLENISQEKFDESPSVSKISKNQYHYNIKLTRNLKRNNIHSQILNPNHSNNNYSFIEKNYKKNYNNVFQDNQNRSGIIQSFHYKNDLFNEESENINPNKNSELYNNKNKNIFIKNNCILNRCPKCNCFQSENQDFIDNEEENKNNTNMNNNSNSNIINYDKKMKYEKSKEKANFSPLSKDCYINKNNNNLNLDYSMDNMKTNIINKQNQNGIYNRGNLKNKLNSFYPNNKEIKNIYRNSNKLNYNSNTNKTYYYLESSYNDSNFKISQINSSFSNSNINKNNNNIQYNTKKILKSGKFLALYDLFLDFIKQDSIIETMRQLLSNREDSNLVDLFSMFDYSGNGFVLASDFIRTLIQLGLKLDKHDITFLFRKFDKKINDSLDFDEFCEIVLPKKHSNEKIMGTQTKSNVFNRVGIRDYPNNNLFHEISKETKKMLGLLFKNVIEGEKSNENFRKILAENEEMSGFDLFNKIKKNYSVGIYKEDIANFMKKNKYKLNNNEIELLMERFDKNKNGMIDYKEFIIEISPINKQ